MAKGQKRSGREAKKPKTGKKKDHTPAYLLAEAQQTAQKIVPEGSATKH